MLKSDGSLWAWGGNVSGQLGNGRTSRQATAEQVPGLMDVATVTGGESHSLGNKRDGTVWVSVLAFFEEIVITVFAGLVGR